MAYYGPFAQLEQLGLFDVILPFILVFTIVFAILQKAKLFGEEDENKKFHVMISLVMGLAVVFPHVLGYYPPDRDIVNIINQSLPNVSIVLVAILMALLIIGVLGKKFELDGEAWTSGGMVLIAFLAIGYIFGNAAGWWDSPAWLYFLGDRETVTLIIAILIFAIIIWFITKSDEPATPGEGFFADVSKHLK